MIEIPMTVIWLVAAVVFAVVEAATMGLTAIWFSAGSLVAMVGAMLYAPVWLQIVLFIIVSGIVLYFTRGLSKKYINNRHVKTNADRVVGLEGLVTQAIDNDAAQGQIRVGGQVWTARATREDTIEEGAKVEVVAIEGVKAMVVRLDTAHAVSSATADTNSL